MSDSDIPAELQRLIVAALRSMDYVEVLFHVAMDGSPKTAEELAAATGLRADAVSRILADLEVEGITRRSGMAFVLEEASRHRKGIEQFVKIYTKRPMSVVRAVYTRPSSATNFADAFRLRRDD